MLVWTLSAAWQILTTLVWILRCAVPLLCDALAAVAVALWASRRAPPPRSASLTRAVRCVACRGARLDAPPHTIQAFKYCIEKGCRDIEFDVCITRDGNCILSHESKIGDKEISNNDWADLKDIPAGTGHPMSDKFGVVNLCLLEDAVKFLIPNEVKFIINVNIIDKRIFSHVIETFKKHPEMYDKAVVASFNPLILYRLRYLDSSIVSALNYHPRSFSSISYSAFSTRKRFPGNVLLHLGARILDEIYSIIWSTRIFPYWTGCSAVILHKDIASPSIIEGWREARYVVFLWGVNQPLDKHYVAKALRVPYITDTLTGEPREITGEMNGKTH